MSGPETWNARSTRCDARTVPGYFIAPPAVPAPTVIIFTGRATSSAAFSSFFLQEVITGIRTAIKRIINKDFNIFLQCSLGFMGIASLFILDFPEWTTE